MNGDIAVAIRPMVHKTSIFPQISRITPDFSLYKRRTIRMLLSHSRG